MDSKIEPPILVTGAAGQVGAVGRTIVELLRQRGLEVRALVRRDDERASGLRATGAEVVVGGVTNASDVTRALPARLRSCGFGLWRAERMLHLQGNLFPTPGA